MRAHPHCYKHPNMSLDAFREYLAEEVGVMGTDVGLDVVQGAADLLRTRMVRTYARGKDIKVKKIKNKQKPTKNEETSTRERFEANIESRIKTVVEKSQESKEKDKGNDHFVLTMED
ncbi:hypothetical protein Tco_0332684 [Tanacetum coccineum]